MTKCGHTFCYLCMLRCMEGKVHCKCPMCTEMVSRDDLKPVSYSRYSPPEVQEPFSLSLLQSVKGHVSPRLVEENSKAVDMEESTPPSGLAAVIPHLTSVESRFSRIGCLSAAELATTVLTEIQALESFRLECLDTSLSTGDVEALPYITEAVYLLEDKYKDLTSRASLKKGSSSSATANHIGSEGAHYLYQSSEGSPVFLHPLCMQCMIHEYGDGDGSSLPLSLSVVIVDVERVRLSRGMRYRTPFLQHLPENCDAYMVEIDMRELVSKSTMHQFKDEFQKRVKQRKVREKEIILTQRSDADSK
jgi:hypothetical protein